MLSVNRPGELRSGTAALPALVRVGVVADRRTTRVALAEVLRSDPELEVLGVAAGSRGGVELLERPELDVLIVNLTLATRDGRSPAVEFIRLARSLRPELGILSLKRQTEERLVRAAIDAGANACCLATTPQSRLTKAIKAVAEGATWLDPEISCVLFNRSLRLPSPLGRAAGADGNRHDDERARRERTFSLSPRERDVLRLVTEGHTNGQIAAALHCGPATIKTHLTHLFRKLSVCDRVSAAVLALRYELV
jgi:DNA-binding NarL/FixJ family response regulator